MPGMSGLELLPKAKSARPTLRHHDHRLDADTKRKALEGGVETLLTKPIDFVALRSEIDNRVAELESTFVEGQTRKLARLNGMSVLSSTADVVGPPQHVRVVP